MKQSYLLDTSVLSGLLTKEAKYLAALENYREANWAISAISEFELYLYKEKHKLKTKAFIDFLDPFIIIPLQRPIFEAAAKIFISRDHSRPHIADLLITATAIVHGLKLITGDWDMAKYRDAEVLLI